jgi:hypothetical protein
MPEEHVSGIERELAALLAVDASPEFAAGVRARIARTGPSRRWIPWALVAAAVLVAAVGAMLIRTVPESSVVPPRPIDAAGNRAVVDGLSQPAAPVTPARAHAPATVHARSAPRTEAPEIIIDPAFNLAVQRLVRAAQQRPAEFARVSAVAAIDAPPTDLAVAPMTIDDLAVPVIKVGEPQMGASR